MHVTSHFGNLTVTICRPYFPASLLVPGAGLNIMQYNTVLNSTECVKITAPNTVLGSTVCLKNIAVGSTVRAINQYLFIKNPISPGLNSKVWGKNTVLISIGNYIGNVYSKFKTFA